MTTFLIEVADADLNTVSKLVKALPSIRYVEASFRPPFLKASTNNNDPDYNLQRAIKQIPEVLSVKVRKLDAS